MFVLKLSYDMLNEVRKLSSSMKLIDYVKLCYDTRNHKLSFNYLFIVKVLRVGFENYISAFLPSMS